MQISIQKVYATQGTREGNKFCIEGYTLGIIRLGDVLKLNYNDKNYYFKTISISTDLKNGNCILFTANEYGYSNLLSKTLKDIKEIVGKPIEIETDEHVLERLVRTSCYC